MIELTGIPGILILNEEPIRAISCQNSTAEVVSLVVAEDKPSLRAVLILIIIESASTSTAQGNC